MTTWDIETEGSGSMQLRCCKFRFDNLNTENMNIIKSEERAFFLVFF